MKLPALTIGIILAVSGFTLSLSGAMEGAGQPDTPTAESCATPGDWIDARSGEALDWGAYSSELTTRSAVLLGESHDNGEHHRWQLHTLAALDTQAEQLVIGFESFPRRVQPVLDRWVRGELTEKAFLKEVDWRKIWGFDPGLYMPMFDFARMNGIPMVALNVERSLVARVGAEGWDAIAENDREGLSDPAEASDDYKRSLAEVYLTKMMMRSSGEAHGDGASSSASHPIGADVIEGILTDADFKRFAAAQLTWDRAMAQAIHDAKTEHPDALVVGILGSGHLAHFHGVPHQLADLGIADSAVLIPAEVPQLCDRIGTNYADALYAVSGRDRTKERPKRMMLGVFLEPDQEAVIVSSVMPDSVAEATQLQAGDRFLRAAGVELTDAASLIEIISRQAPGTWLPITIERQGTEVELIAKFPPSSKEGS